MRALFLLSVFGSCLWAQQQPILDLADQADLITFATLDRIVAQPPGTGGDGVVELRMGRSIKGVPDSPLLTVRVSVRPGGNVIGPVQLSQNTVGRSGLWFLKKSGSTYMTLPEAGNMNPPRDPSFPFPDSRIDDGDVPQQLLSLAVRWYLFLPSPSRDDEGILWRAVNPFTSKSVPLQQRLAAIQPLVRSSNPTQAMTGIELAIQMGSLDALNVFLDRIAEFKASPRAVNLGSAIGNYALKDASWRPPLKGLLAMHLGIHDLDWGAAGAIAKLRDPADLPFLVTFLDHEDPNLVWMVGRHLASFARTNQIYTNQVKQYEQVKILSMPNAQYAELWKSWWEANKAALRIR